MHLSPTDAGSGVDETRYSVNGSAVATYGAGIDISAEGTNTIEYSSIDAVGNREATKTAQVRIDQTAPVTTADAPSGWQTADTTVELTATDAHSGIANRYYRLNSGVVRTYSAPFTISAEGTTTVEFWSVDVVGNVEESSSKTVRIDKTAAVTSQDAPVGWSKADVVVHLTATDGTSGVDKTYYRLDGSAPSIVATAGTVVSAEGTTTVRYYSTDIAGNAEAVKSVDVRIDKTKPATTDDAPRGLGWRRR